jgi:hypothetical protein
VLLAVAAVLWRRRRLAWCAAAAGVLGWAFSLGAVAGGTESWAPWRLLYRIPLVGNILPPRFSLFYDLAAALLLALTLDVLWARRDRVATWFRRGRPDHAGRPHHAARPHHAGRLVGVAGCAVALLALVPVGLVARPFAVHDDPVPLWFRLVAPTLPAGEVILAMPDAASGATEAMAWQADDDFGFAMIGGEAQVPGGDGRRSIHVVPPTGPEGLIDALSWGVGSEPAVSPAQVSATRRALATWGVQVVVVTDQTRYIPYAVGFVTEVLGRAPRYEAGAWVWYGLGDDAPLSVSGPWLRQCAADAQITVAPLEVSSCVMSHAARVPA